MHKTKNQALSSLGEIPPGSYKAVRKTMWHQAWAVRIGAFLLAAGVGGMISLLMDQTVGVSITFAFIAGLFALGAAAFITSINTQATIAKKHDQVAHVKEKSTND